MKDLKCGIFFFLQLILPPPCNGYSMYRYIYFFSFFDFQLETQTDRKQGLYTETEDFTENWAAIIEVGSTKGRVKERVVR